MMYFKKLSRQASNKLHCNGVGSRVEDRVRVEDGVRTHPHSTILSSIVRASKKGYWAACMLLQRRQLISKQTASQTFQKASQPHHLQKLQ